MLSRESTWNPICFGAFDFVKSHCVANGISAAHLSLRSLVCNLFSPNKAASMEVNLFDICDKERNQNSYKIVFEKSACKNY
jgi:hypothetical protein